MIKLKNIKDKDGHTNCHTKNVRTRPDRLVGNSRQQDNRTHLYERRSEQDTKISRRLGIRRPKKKRNLPKALEHQMAICKRKLQRLERVRLVQTDESSFAFRKRFLERRYLCLCRKGY